MMDRDNYSIASTNKNAILLEKFHFFTSKFVLIYLSVVQAALL